MCIFLYRYVLFHICSDTVLWAELSQITKNTEAIPAQETFGDGLEFYYQIWSNLKLVLVLLRTFSTFTLFIICLQLFLMQLQVGLIQQVLTSPNSIWLVYFYLVIWAYLVMFSFDFLVDGSNCSECHEAFSGKKKYICTCYILNIRK